MRLGPAWLLLCCWIAPAGAELDAADYQVDDVNRSTPQRAQIQAETDRDKDRAAARARQEAAEEAQRHADAEAAAARRPYAQRLLDARCTQCHPAENFLNARHTLLGWHLVVGRMRWVHRAPFNWSEQRIVARELVRQRPVAADGAAIEWAAAAGAVTLPGLAVWTGWRWVRHRRRQEDARR